MLLTSDSPWQRALAREIDDAEGVRLAAVVVQELPSTLRPGWLARALVREPLRILSKAAQRVLYGGVLRRIASEELRRFGSDGAPLPWPTAPLTRVRDINGPEAVEAIRRADPALVAVSGTRLIREPVFALEPEAGMINLHTGISPYYRGGPNCTLWALANREPWCIGSTVHVLTPAVDAGPLLITARTPVEADATVEGLVSAAVETGHRIYRRALEEIGARGGVPPGVPQTALGEGRTFRVAEWSVLDLARAVRYVESGGLRRWVRAGRPGTDAVRLVDVFRDPSSTGG